MANEPENIGGLPITSETIRYASDEMIGCGTCAKPNPPNRLNCLYCGSALELPDEVAARIRFRPSEIEDWEPGVNLIVTAVPPDLDAKAISSAISFSEEIVDSLSNVEPPLPLFRVKAEDANEVEARLTRLGLEVSRVEDLALSLSSPPVRLKGIGFDEGALSLYPFNSSYVLSLNMADVAVIIVGSIITSTAESKLKKKRKETKEFDEYTASSDHLAIDIHTSRDRIGYRILPHGFDFSCLGEEKSLVAADNVRKLIEKLSEFLPAAVIDRSYASKSAILDHVWPRTVANTSKGIERNWFGVQRATGFRTSNETQFTRYSRVRRNLL